MDPIICVHDLCTAFATENGGLNVLENISFDIQEQEFVCILGPSGSGKSTLLKILAGLLPSTSGQVLYRGEVLKSPQRSIGFVFQKANLMPWRTVVENIALPLELGCASPECVETRAQEMVKFLGLQGFENSLPRDLSGGMAQRVAIGRALIHDPDVLLLDEPFGMLDALTRERMGMELLQIWQIRKKTVIMVTHSIEEALLLADRVLVLSNRPGRLCLDLTVTLPRPRSEDLHYTPEFGELAKRLRTAIGHV